MPTTRTSKTAAKKTAAKVTRSPRAATAARTTRAKAARPAAAKPELLEEEATETAPEPQRKSAARKAKPALWTPRPMAIHELSGKPSDPRLAAALAARERWHGRSGRPALKSGTQAVAFVRERRLVHRTVRSPMPNLIDPIVGHSVREEERNEGQIFQTLQSWNRDLANSPDILEIRLCFERPTLVASDLWPALALVAAPREEAARDDGRHLSEEARETLEILDRRGVLSVERLRQMLGLGPEEFAAVQGELESHLLVVARGDRDEEGEPITVLEPLGRWAERAIVRRMELEPGRAWTLLFMAALRSAVVLWPEEIEALFPWTAEERENAVQEAIGTGTMINYVEDGSTAWVASPVPR